MINIIDNFYEPNEFNEVVTVAHLNPYTATYQPNDIFYPDRLKAYPCYETKVLDSQDLLFKTFCSTFEKKSNLKIKAVKTFIRKILNSELEHVFKYRLPSHQDNGSVLGNKVQIAGLIYINTFNLIDGTYIYSHQHQIEPDIMVGSKPNRCVYYSSDLWHSPGHDKNTEIRLVQPFFITLE